MNEAKVVDFVPKMLSVTDAIKYSGLPEGVIRKLIRTEKVSYIRSGKKYFVPVSALDQIIENGITL